MADLLPVHSGYRFQEIKAPHTERTLSDGQNPPDGIALNYFLKDTTDKFAKITILKDGNIIQEMEVPHKVGMNRIWWDLRHKAPIKAVLRTLPPDKPWVKFDKDSTRRPVTWDLDLMGGLLGPRATPGKYTAQIEVNGEKKSQTFEVLKDPNAKNLATDLEEQVAFSLQLRDALNQTVTLINELEVIRKQTADLLKNTPEKQRKKYQNLLKIKHLTCGYLNKLLPIYQPNCTTFT
ncbi:MAG: hypothetical protein R2822_06095 [Spirosomataceae bacterium]